MLEQRAGIAVFRVTGARAADTFADEGGGHRWQRVPPGSREGKVHSSTITVAVLPEPTAAEVVLRDSDLTWTTCRGSGAGGQHRNVTDSAVQITHRPSGLSVRCESERSQHQNRETALALLRARLLQRATDQRAAARDADRRGQVGCGARGDKRRTVRVRDEQVNDHITGRAWRLRDYVRGEW